MVDIPATIQKKWSIFGKHGLTISVIYQSVSEDSYNESTGVVTTGSTTDQTIDIILDEFNQTEKKSAYSREDDIEILSIDKKVLFPALDLTATPKIDDIITIGSDDWMVKGVATDPAVAVYTLHVRPTPALTSGGGGGGGPA